MFKINHFALAEELLAKVEVAGNQAATNVALALATTAQAHATLALAQAIATRPIVLDVSTEDDPEGLIGEALSFEVQEYRAAFGATEFEGTGSDPLPAD